MTISLGGGNDGPANGGMTSIGGRAVQDVKPPDEPKRPEAVRPPAAAVPEMTVPLPNKTPTKSPPPPKVAQAPDQARGRTPTRGAETRDGSALAETGARGQGFGLSSASGVGSGIPARRRRFLLSGLHRPDGGSRTSELGSPRGSGRCCDREIHDST